MLISGILAVLYTFIFVIIQLQDYALLIGSIGLFIILGLVMYFSRKIDWYNLNLQEKNEQK
jgi:inner membrane protein